MSDLHEKCLTLCGFAHEGGDADSWHGRNHHNFNEHPRSPKVGGEASPRRRVCGIDPLAVVHGDVAYFSGITPNPIVGDIKTQTAQVLRRVDELLNLVGTDKSQPG